jgi:transposase
MPSQHSIEKGLSQEEGRRQAEEGIVVPLELPEWRILKQEVQPDGTIRVEVMGTNERAKCPHCDAICVKRHDVRPRSKRDVPLRGHRVELVVYKRRFWCLRWKPRVHRAGSCLRQRQAHDGAAARGDWQASLHSPHRARGKASMAWVPVSCKGVRKW